MSLRTLVPGLLALAVLLSTVTPAEAEVHLKVGQGGQYTSVQAAIDAVPTGGAERYVIDVSPGTYTGRVLVPSDKPKITLRGQDPLTTKITFDETANTPPNDRYVHATTVILGKDFIAENLTFENSYGPGVQALAMYAKADRLIFDNVRFLGWQDTLRSEGGRHYFHNVYVEGSVDFVYGRGTAYFEDSTLYAKANGYLTAQAREAEAETNGYVFRNSTIIGDANPASVYLGRPWQPYSRAVFIDSNMGPIINPSGWSTWSGNNNHLTAYFAEYNSMDLDGNPLDVSQRASWSHQLTALEANAFSKENWLSGSDGWDPVAPVLPELAGDYNGDGIVNLGDYTVWRDNLGGTFDLNGNGDESDESAGVVDAADYELWRSNYGETPAASASVSASTTQTAVPEPGTAILGLFGLALVGRVRRRRATWSLLSIAILSTRLTLLLSTLLTTLAAAATAQTIPAFSGASGPGGTATGGRGGDVYHVTTLDADKDGAVPGSLQYGINTAPSTGRTIVFDVGGTIYLDGLTAQDRLRYGKANITVAGQTAPGPGITIAGTGSKWTGDNIILRNLSIRPNINSNGTTHDSFDMQLKNSIVDHVSATWFTDEGISQTDSGINTTFQYALIGEGLNYAGHSYGSIIATEVDGTHVSFNHNLYAHNNSRMPRLGSETGETGAVLDWSNNVVYNWQSRAGYSGTVQQSRSNFIGNYYIKGPNNGTTAFLGGDNASSIGYTQVYQSTDPSLANRFDDDKDGVLHDGIIFGPTTTLPNSSGQKAYSGTLTFVDSPFTVDGVDAPETADVALDRVLAYGGANWSNRSPIDQRIFGSVISGTGALINDLGSGPQAGEWATLLAQQSAVSRPAGWDGDGDGMPGFWEREHGLDPDVANNNADFDNDGYTDVEEYLNDIAAWPAPQPIVFSGAINGRYAQITNWDIQWQPSRFDTAVINGGTVTVDAVGQHAGNLTLGANSGDSPTLNITFGWIKVEDAPHGLSDGMTVIGEHAAATATLNLSGGMLRTETLDKNAGSSFNFTGGVLAADIIDFTLVNNGGTIAPGDRLGDAFGEAVSADLIGSTMVAGDATFNAGTLEIELLSPTESDFLGVSGALNLGGDLKVSLLDGFAPTSGFWVIATASNFTGNFDSVTPGFAVSKQGGDLVLSIAAGLAGDYNDDGIVNLADYTVWRDSLGAPAGTLDNDPNPGVIGTAQYNTWKANFGAMLPSTGSIRNAAVPEPSTCILLSLLALAMACRNRRARQ